MTTGAQTRSIFSRSRVNLAAAFVAFGLMGATTAQAAPVFADWAAGAIDGNAITVTDVSGPTSSGVIANQSFTATDANFIATYGETFSILTFSAQQAPGNLLADISFANALPANSLLFAFDMDFRSETFVISSGSNFLALLGQGESQAGQMSDLPTYDPLNGNLVSAYTGTDNNEQEFSVFDASGLSSLSIQWLNGGASSGSFIALATPGTPPTTTPVPLPAGLPLLLAGLAGFGILGRRKNS